MAASFSVNFVHLAPLNKGKNGSLETPLKSPLTSLLSALHQSRQTLHGT
jgi:hypothetical protein